MIYINPYSFAGLDAVTVAWLAQLTTSFGSNPSSSYITALDTMIRGMRTDGDLTKLDRFWIFAQEVQGYARVSIVNPTSTQITEVNSPTFTANQGYTGNGVNRYLNTNFNLSTQSSNYTLNSACHGGYSRTNAALASTEGGCFLHPTYTNLSVKFSDNTCYSSTNNGSTSDGSVAMPTSTGLIAGVRTASNNHTIYRNGAEMAGVANKTTVSGSLLSLSYFVLATSSNGSPVNYSSRQLSMWFHGSGTISQANFYSRFQTFATTIGFNV